jgi:hypothetical protein
MPKDDQRQTSRRREIPDSADDTDSIVELSLKLAKAARKRRLQLLASLRIAPRRRVSTASFNDVSVNPIS